jgi:hypothetical protein
VSWLSIWPGHNFEKGKEEHHAPNTGQSGMMWRLSTLLTEMGQFGME